MASASSFLNTSTLNTSYYVTDHAPLTPTVVTVTGGDVATNTQTRDLLSLNSRLDDILARTRSQSALGVRVSPPKVSTTTETYLRSSPSTLRLSGYGTNLRNSNAELKAILKTDTSPSLRRSLVDGTKKTVTFASPAVGDSGLTKSYSTSYLNTNLYTLPTTSVTTVPVTTSYAEKPSYSYLNTINTSTYTAPAAKTSSPSRADYKYTLYEPITYTATRTSDPLTYTSTKVESPSYKTASYTAIKTESPSYTKVVEPASYYTTTVREPTYTTATVLEPYTYTTTRVVEPTSYVSTSLNDLNLSYKPAPISYESTYKKSASPVVSPSRYTTYETTKTVSPSKLKYDKERLDQLISRIQTTKATYSPTKISYSPSSKTNNYASLTTSYVPASTSQYQYVSTTPLPTSSVNSSYLYTSSTPYYTSTTAAAPYHSSTSYIKSAPYVDTERVKSSGTGKKTTEYQYQSQGQGQTHLGKLENDVESLTFDDYTGEPNRTKAKNY